MTAWAAVWASGARVGAHSGAGRAVGSGAGLGTLGAVWGRVRLDRGAGSATGADSVYGWTA